MASQRLHRLKIDIIREQLVLETENMNKFTDGQGNSSFSFDWDLRKPYKGISELQNPDNGPKKGLNINKGSLETFLLSHQGRRRHLEQIHHHQRLVWSRL